MAKLSKEAMASQGFSTRSIHAGQEPAPGNGAIITPIYQTSTFVQESPGVYQGYDYSRADNPTRDALEQNLAALENAAAAVAFSSGCAAADAVLHLLSHGDHVISCDDLYGGSYRLFEQVFRRAGLDFTYLDLTDVEAFEAAFKPNTKLVWFETPTNPLLKVFDIKRLSDIAHANGAMVLVDNTFATPYLQNPLRCGADLVLHSTTKYLGGHSDLIGGVVMTDREDLHEQLAFLQKSIGAIQSPFECFLILRSTKTLGARMRLHCENAAVIADFLAGRKDVERVLYPGHSDHPQAETAKQQMSCGGGMVSMVLAGGLERSRSFLESVKVFTLAESLGGVESLVDHPKIMTHASMPEHVLERLGIVDGLVRLSVGIEDIDDLIADLAQALDGSQ